MSTLYPCISYLDSESEKEIRTIQKEIFEISGAKSSLEEWRPHITVGRGLNYKKEIPADLIEKLSTFTKTQSSFQVELKNFGYMDDWKGSALFNCEPYVIYIDVIINPILQTFVDKLDSILKEYAFSYEIHPYNPHLTLAFKDLDKEGFEKSKDYLSQQSFSKTITIDSFSIANDEIEKNIFKEIHNFQLQ